MVGKKQKSIINLVLIAVLALVVIFTYSFIQNDQKSFVVKYGEKSFTSVSEHTLALSADRNLIFNCEEFFQPTNDFDVKIVTTKTFDYLANGNNLRFLSGEDVSSYFNLQKSNGGFTFFIPSNMTMFDVVVDVKGLVGSSENKNLRPSKGEEEENAIEVPDFNFVTEEMFAIVVTAKSGDIVRISFKIQAILGNMPSILLFLGGDNG